MLNAVLTVAVGVSSVLLLSVAWSLLTSRSADVMPPVTVTCSRTRAAAAGGGGCGGEMMMGEGEGGGKGGGGVGGVVRCPSGDSCPWQFVLSDLTNRLHLLEAAFKEQVLAREMMAQEVTNQTGSNQLIEHKLHAFLRRVEEVERNVRKLEGRLNELSTRLHSDEFIGFVVILAIMVEVLLRVRPRVAGHFGPWGSDIMARYRRWSHGPDMPPNFSSPTPTPTTSLTTSQTLTTSSGVGGSSSSSSNNGGGGNRSLVDGRPEGVGMMGVGVGETHHSNGGAPQVFKPFSSSSSSSSTASTTTSITANGVSFSPKHGLFLKSELCVIAFRRDNPPLSAFVNAVVRHLDDVRVSVRPYYVIESHEHLRQSPRAKLYLVIFEMEERVSSSCRPQDADLITSTVRYIKSLGATLILIVTNDEGSKKLTVHALYNTHLRLLQSHEAFQDLTSSGRVFSAWRELNSHQTSHMRKIAKSALNLKTSLR
ncbi:hypothetical protein ACOMHN_014425 [Nucella lapillus]